MYKCCQVHPEDSNSMNKTQTGSDVPRQDRPNQQKSDTDSQKNAAEILLISNKPHWDDREYDNHHLESPLDLSIILVNGDVLLPDGKILDKSLNPLKT